MNIRTLIFTIALSASSSMSCPSLEVIIGNNTYSGQSDTISLLAEYPVIIMYHVLNSTQPTDSFPISLANTAPYGASTKDLTDTSMIYTPKLADTVDVFYWEFTLNSKDTVCSDIKIYMKVLKSSSVLFEKADKNNLTKDHIGGYKTVYSLLGRRIPIANFKKVRIDSPIMKSQK
jgi:hypothetical protein